MIVAIPHTHFDRSPASDAIEPPEAHGVARDGVKLLVAQPSGISHARFADLGDYLRPGDLLVVNNSATLPAAVDGSRSGQPITVHFPATITSGLSNSDRQRTQLDICPTFWQASASICPTAPPSW